MPAMYPVKTGCKELHQEDIGRDSSSAFRKTCFEAEPCRILAFVGLG
jgi:hypothetical protein